MQTQRIDITQLSSDPANARKHSQRNIEAIASSLRRFGQQKPIVVDKSNVVRAGNGTLEAARHLGWDQIDVVFTNLESSEATAFAIADNRTAELAEWNDDVLAASLQGLDEELQAAAGYEGKELDQILSTLDTTDVVEDEVPEVPDDPTTQPGDLWLLGDHRLLCGDSTSADDVERLLDGAEPSLMVTDPPYGVEYDPKRRRIVDSNRKLSGALGMVKNDIRADWTESLRHFRGAAAYVYHADRFTGRVFASLEAIGLTPRSLIIWDKGHAAPLPYGINKKQVASLGLYHHQHEPCWYAIRANASVGWIGGGSQTTVWGIDKNNKNETGHSTQKPLECMARPIRNHTAEKVYDPFLGSGTTLIAAEQLGRKCYGMELSPQYCDVIVERWQNLTGKEARRDGT